MSTGGGRDTGTPRLVTAVTAAAVAAATAVLLGLAQLGVAHPPLRLRAAAVTVSAVLAFVSTTGSAVGTWRRGRDAARRDRIAFVLRTLAYTVQDLTDLDTRELGVALHLLRADRWPPSAAAANLAAVFVPGRRAPRLRLVRVVRERASRRPSTSGVVWRPGKGVIGLCVATGDVVGQDVGADTAPWVGAGTSAGGHGASVAGGVVDRWTLVPEDVRGSFTRAEFDALAGRYGTVLAAPLIDDGGTGSAVVGCVSLDGPHGSFELLWSPDVRSALAQAAETLRRLVL